MPTIRTLRELERHLSSLSHSEGALDAVKEFSASLRSSSERVAVFNANGAMVRSPISSDETRAAGFDRPDDDFRLLQGDTVATDPHFSWRARHKFAQIRRPKLFVRPCSKQTVECRTIAHPRGSETRGKRQGEVKPASTVQADRIHVLASASMRP